MITDLRLGVFITGLLILGNGFFVAAEYGLIGARRSRIESLAQKNNTSAKYLLRALDNIASYVAGIQIVITMLGIAIGAITESFVTEEIDKILGDTVGRGASTFISVLLVTYILVIVGELVPKYITLKYAENVALAFIRPLSFFIVLLTPLVWLVKKSGAAILRPLKIDMTKAIEENFSKEELVILFKSGTDSGMFEKEHAALLSKALKLDILDAENVMIHRVDMKWIDISTPKEVLFKRLSEIHHSYIPVCEGDIDHVKGILYLPDAVSYWNQKDFSLKTITQHVEAVPENLSLSRVLSHMRKAKTQALLVLDEYGGTSGLITLEDIIAEVFGEFEDEADSAQAPIKQQSESLYLARADVRYDEMIDFIKLPSHEDILTDTLAVLIVRANDKIPTLGDSVETEIGTIAVTKMNHHRITEMSVQLNQTTLEKIKALKQEK